MLSHISLATFSRLIPIRGNREKRVFYGGSTVFERAWQRARIVSGTSKLAEAKFLRHKSLRCLTEP